MSNLDEILAFFDVLLAPLQLSLALLHLEAQQFLAADVVSVDAGRSANAAALFVPFLNRSLRLACSQPNELVTSKIKFYIYTRP